MSLPTRAADRVLQVIEKHQPVHAVKIARLLGVKRDSIYSAIGALMTAGRVRRYKTQLCDPNISAHPLTHYCLASMPISEAESTGDFPVACHRGPAPHATVARPRLKARTGSGVVAGPCISRSYALWGGYGRR